MATINLLPWRDHLREERKKHFFVALGSSVFAVGLIMFFAHLTIASWVNKQEGRNLFLQNEISKLDGKIHEILELKQKKAALVARMKIIQELQSNRPMIVHLMDELVKILPTGVHLSSISRADNKIIIYGKAESNANISELMRNITASLWLTNPMLSEIKTEKNKGQRISDFRLQLSQKGSDQQVKGDFSRGI